MRASRAADGIHLRGRPGLRAVLRRARRRRVAAFAALLVVSTVVGLSTGPPRGTSAAELLQGAFVAFLRAPTVHVSGRVGFPDGSIDVELDIQHPRQARGLIWEGTRGIDPPDHVIIVGDHMFTWRPGTTLVLLGPQVARITGERWIVQATAHTWFALVDAQSFARTFFGPSDHSRLTPVVRDNHLLLQIPSQGIRYYLAAALPHRLAALEADPGVTRGDEAQFSRFRLTFSEYNKTTDIVIPTDALDPYDPSTLPGDYASLVFRYGFCDIFTACESMLVVNRGGAGHGRVIFAVFTPDQQQELARCVKDIPDLAYQQTAELSCAFQGPDLAAYIRSHPGQSLAFRGHPYNTADPEGAVIRPQ